MTILDGGALLGYLAPQGESNVFSGHVHVNESRLSPERQRLGLQLVFATAALLAAGVASLGSDLKQAESPISRARASIEPRTWQFRSMPSSSTYFILAAQASAHRTCRDSGRRPTAAV
jgi:hypothetical protein